MFLNLVRTFILKRESNEIKQNNVSFKQFKENVTINIRYLQIKYDLIKIPISQKNVQIYLLCSLGGTGRCRSCMLYYCCVGETIYHVIENREDRRGLPKGGESEIPIQTTSRLRILLHVMFYTASRCSPLPCVTSDYTGVTAFRPRCITRHRDPK